MASTQTWSEFNGASLTETTNRTECNWKNVDDSTTAYSSSVITAGANSFSKQQCVVFAGTWNSLSALTYKVSSNAPGTGLSVIGKVINTAYAQGSTTATGDGAASTTGASANFGTSSNSSGFAAGTATASGGGTCYTNAFRTQLQTTTSAAPGDIATVTITATWTES